MELFLLFLYAVTVFALYQSIEMDDTDFTDEDSGEFNLIDSI